MDSDIGLFGTVIAVVAVIISLMYRLQKPLSVTDYVVNTYLYILLAILLCALMILIFDRYQLFDVRSFSSLKMFSLFILMILVLCGFMLISPRHTILRNGLWVAFIVLIAVTLYPLYEVTKASGVLWKSLVTVVILVLGLTLVASMVPEGFFNSWGPYLIMGLVGLIIFQVLDTLFSDPATVRGHFKVYAVIGILIFSGLVLYDTGRLYQNAKIVTALCPTPGEQLKCADYPGESLSLFLDIVNLFSSTSMLQMS